MRIRVQFIHVCFGAGFVLAMAAVAVVTGTSAKRQDAQYLAAQQIVARGEVANAYQYLRGQVRQMTYWQDAYTNIVAKWNSDWVAYQFGAYQDVMGNHRTALIGANDTLLFLHAPANELALRRDAVQHAKGLDTLLRKIRKNGAHQSPAMANGVIVSGGQPYFAVAALVTPEEQGDLAAASRAPVAAVFFHPVTADDFKDFLARSDAKDIHFAADGLHANEYRSLALNDADSNPIVWLQWKPHMPGIDSGNQFALPLTIVFLIYMLIQIVMIDRWLALQQRVLRSQAEARAAIEQSRRKSVFLGTISHDLRTPLNAIIGYADVLCCQMFGPLGNPRNVEYVGDIRTSGRHLLKIVNDLIEIARIEAGDKCGDDEAFDAANAALQAINALQDCIQDKALRVALIRPDVPAVCRGSLISLSQAIGRILSNAIRYSPEGGGIAIELTTDGKKVTIEIRDEGEGIAPERLADFARPLGLPDNHLVATGKGLGFGIAIAKGLIKLMDGSFAITSTLGTGTTVRMILPAERLHKSSAAAPPGESSGTSSQERDVPARAAGSRR